MPRQDGTGPLGQGPLTGRGMGPCGRGARRGFGRGFGLRFAQPIQFSDADEKNLLQDELEVLKQEMQEIEKRLKELKSNK